jgi:hypothetical protein
MNVPVTSVSSHFFVLSRVLRPPVISPLLCITVPSRVTAGPKLELAKVVQ